MSVSVPGFVLRKESSCNVANNAIRLFTSFFECSLNKHPRVCRNRICALQSFSGTAEDEITAAARMARATSCASEYEIYFHEAYRKLLYSASVVLQCALDVRK